jgi:hypothetical protein
MPILYIMEHIIRLFNSFVRSRLFIDNMTDSNLHLLSRLARSNLFLMIDKERVKQDNVDIMNYAYENNEPVDKTQQKLDTSPNSINNYIVIKTSPDLHNKFIESDTKLDIPIIKQLMKDVLASKRIMKNGRPVRMKNCIVVDAITQPGSYYPNFHTDPEYEIFNRANSFQIWYLVRNKNTTGNMFIMKTSKSNVKYTPSWLHLNGDMINVHNNSIKRDHDVLGQINLDDVTVQYLEIDPGECFVMGQNVWHASDIRTDDRLAINFRVIIREDDGTVKHNGDRIYLRPHHVYDAVRKRAYNIGLFDLL